MNNLYKRIVTLGMVCVSAALAWIYCILEYRTSAALIGVTSFILVFSLYAFLNAFVGLHNEKQQNTKNYLATLIHSSLENASGNRDEMERLAKAAYVQNRKTNTLLSQIIDENRQNRELSMADYTERIADATTKLSSDLTESINKTTKIIVKYNDNNTTRVLSAIERINTELETLSSSISINSSDNRDLIDSGIDRISSQLDALKEQLKNTAFSVSADKEAAVTEAVEAPDSASILDMLDGKGSTATLANDEAFDDLSADKVSDNSEAVEAIAVDTQAAAAEAHIKPAETDFVAEEASIKSEEIQPDTASDDNGIGYMDILSQDSLDSLIESINEHEGAEVTAEGANVVDGGIVSSDVQDNSASEDGPDLDSFFSQYSSKPEDVVDTNPNRQLSPDEIAALFAASKEENKAESNDAFQVFDHPEAMDTSLIDALLDQNDDFEVNTLDESPEAPAAEDGMADVIPFPSQSNEGSDDPNRQLSADEIAALFASVNAPSVNEVVSEEPEVTEAALDEAAASEEPAAPVNDDPNRQLSPDEIAALFASMQ